MSSTSDESKLIHLTEGLQKVLKEEANRSVNQGREEQKCDILI